MGRLQLWNPHKPINLPSCLLQLKVKHIPVASHSAEMEFMELMRCASMALAVSLDNSADQRLVRRMRSWGTQCAYTAASCSMAACPAGLSLPPMSTRSGLVRSAIAVPSARNSGLERIWKSTPGSAQLRRRTYAWMCGR